MVACRADCRYSQVDMGFFCPPPWDCCGAHRCIQAGTCEDFPYGDRKYTQVDNSAHCACSSYTQARSAARGADDGHRCSPVDT